MDPALAALLGGVLGAAAAWAVLLLASRHAMGARYEGRFSPARDAGQGAVGSAGGARATSRAGIPRELVEIVQLLPLSAVLLAPDEAVLASNPPARALGLVDGARLADSRVRALVERARRTGRGGAVELVLAGSRPAAPSLAARVHVAPLSSVPAVVVLAEDLSEARRVDAVRRDFVANVSHELKTPIGGLSLLAEAVTDAADDPEAVRRFAARMHREADRLARLVRELVELSRLEGAEPSPQPRPVEVDRVVAEAVDRCGLEAGRKAIVVVVGGERGVVVLGDERQLVTALGNLVENAVAYSPEGTQVALAVRRSGDGVEVSVTDQGIGIASPDLDRIFERFYRIDPARSRATGGTGLGLAIVKHVATNHGGDVRVWSVEGLGSTFTLRLPLPDPASLEVAS